MQITVLKETDAGETRVALIPDHVKKLIALKASVAIESGAGLAAGATDTDYTTAGATVSSDRQALLGAADILLAVNRPAAGDITQVKPGATVIGFLKPLDDPQSLTPLLGHGLSAFAMEMIPRSTLAQKMDALSSQASLAGYVAVVLGSGRLNKILPMMTTPAGTIAPSKAFIIGAGVAGLQAIATARRLGARVEAFDVRPEVEEQIKSLGARFVKVELGETAGTAQGYAKQLSEQQLDKQREVMAKQCASSDLVISTAQVFGRRAPLILTTPMIEGMKPGSVVIDLAVETGGNVECSKLDAEIMINGVRVIGLPQLARHVPAHASQMYSSNLYNLLEHFWNRETAQFNAGADDDIMKSGLIIRDGQVISDTVKSRMG
ncbi:MAG: NAD(P) transhydrogenase subunit alpha [Blastocatellia bacterium]